jgi:AcrR family transcriptional regulator
MPRIDAPTVAQHRARQESALLEAARALLREAGPHAVTPSAVGARAGLARTSVYKYFRSSGEILGRLVLAAFEDWGATVRAAVDAATTPDERIDAYVRATLQLAASGAHGPATVPAGLHLGPDWQARLAELHHALATPLHQALRSAGTPDPEVTGALIQATLDGAVRLIDAGRPPDQVIPATLTFLRNARHPGRE